MEKTKNDIVTLLRMIRFIRNTYDVVLFPGADRWVFEEIKRIKKEYNITEEDFKQGDIA